MQVFRLYYRLTKPGIVYGNAYTALAGFFIGVNESFYILTALGMLLGICLVMASGCVINNIIDRSIDVKMKRTQKRSLVTGDISVQSAAVFGSGLGLLGVIVLLVSTNVLTASIAVLGWVFYVGVYAVAKRVTVYGTIIGSISGAIPPIVGYTSLRNEIDLGAYIIFFILVFWQLAHFYAIAIIRRVDYKKANIPVLPLKKGIPTTKRHIIISIILFGIACLFLFYYGFTGWVYVACMGILSLIWLVRSVGTYHMADSEKWAKGVFGFSLTVLLVFCIVACVDMIIFKHPQLAISLMVQ